MIINTGHISLENPESEPLEMEFSDGIFVIPEAIVSHLGGTDAVKSTAAKLKTLTYRDYTAAFWKLVTKTKLNQISNKLITDHLRMFGR